jgi:hypothetical protein
MPHWTQTPEGKAKMSKIMKASYEKKKRKNTNKYNTPKADLLEVLNSAWNNLATADKIRALAHLTKEKEA